ncbi:endoplasmic reticulum vesicle transporter-domain-containing protein, partial [Dimargaris cristalligena]
LDAFPKVEASQQSRSAGGGLATVLVSLLLTYLVWGEFHSYWVPISHHEFVVDHTVQHALLINFDITVAMTCQRLTVDSMDVSGSRNHFGERQIKKLPVPFSVGRATDLKAERTLHGLDEDEGGEEADIGELIRKARQFRSHIGSAGAPAQIGSGTDGCRVLGSVVVNKMVGSFHFTLMPQGLADLFMLPRGVNFTHRIDHFSFGVHYPGLVDPLANHFQLAPPAHLVAFHYLISVVPTTYVDAQGRALVTNQYAVKDYSKSWAEDPQARGGQPLGTPGLFFKYDMEPISVRVTETQQSLSRLLTRICAAVGGIFVCVGLIHRL